MVRKTIKTGLTIGIGTAVLAGMPGGHGSHAMPAMQSAAGLLGPITTLRIGGKLMKGFKQKKKRR